MSPNEEEVIRRILDTVSSVSSYMGSELYTTLGGFMDIYRDSYGFSTVQVSFASEGGRRFFTLHLSLTEPTYDPNNYMVRRLSRWFHSSESHYPTSLVNGLECHPGLGEETKVGVEYQGGSVVVTEGSVTVNDSTLGSVTCLKKAMVNFTGEPERPEDLSPRDLMIALSKIVEEARASRSGLFDEFKSLYGFEPGDITLTRNEVMLNTIFDLNMFPSTKSEVERLFRPIVPSGSPVMLGVGILCGSINEPVFSYDSNEDVLVVGLPHEVKGINCLRHILIKYY